MPTRFWLGNLEERDGLKDLVLHWSVILKRILNRMGWGGRQSHVWVTEHVASCCEHGNRSSVPI